MKFGPTDREEAVVFALEELRADVQYEIMKRMKEAGLSQSELAKKIGVSSAWVSQILSDDANLTLESLSKVFLAMGSQCQFKAVPVGAHFYQAMPVEKRARSDEWLIGGATAHGSPADTSTMLMKLIEEKGARPRFIDTQNDNCRTESTLCLEAA